LVGVTPKDQAQFAACIGEPDAVVSRTFPELEALSVEFEKIDTIQSELVLLSDLTTTVEVIVKHSPCPNRRAFENMPFFE
jgi:hypothetical protein